MSDRPDFAPSPIAAQQASALAIASLILGALSWTILPTVGGIAAVVTGHLAKGEIRRSGGTLTGDGLATAGLVLGYANLIFTLLGLCLAAAAIAGLISLSFLCAPFTNSIEIGVLFPFLRLW
jgi:hypothetical protein